MLAEHTGGGAKVLRDRERTAEEAEYDAEHGHGRVCQKSRVLQHKIETGLITLEHLFENECESPRGKQAGQKAF
jgi:hypothetical protein